MDRFSVQDEGIKRARGIKALAIEVGVIASLVVVIVFVLGYFNVIDLSTFLPKQRTVDTQIPVITKAPALSTNSRRFASQLDEAITSAKTINQYQGVITFITTAEGVEKGQRDVNYKAKIILQGKGKNPSTILLDDDAVRIVRVVERGANKEIQLSITDLKLDDEVKVVVTRSLSFETAAYEYTDFEIERIAK